MKIRPIHIAFAIVTLLVAACIAGNGVAVANQLITGHDIKDGTVRKVDLGSGLQAKIDKRTQPGAPGQQGPTGEQGPQGPRGIAGPSGVVGAYYSVAEYNAGDTNAGAIATVACRDTTDVAIAGGVQVLGLGVGSQQRNTPVSSSFPGRMDWSTNEPRPDRLDGWIVQFGGNAGSVSDVAPEHVKIWALCLPGQTVPVDQTYTQVD